MRVKVRRVEERERERERQEASERVFHCMKQHDLTRWTARVSISQMDATCYLPLHAFFSILSLSLAAFANVSCPFTFLAFSVVPPLTHRHVFDPKKNMDRQTGRQAGGHVLPCSLTRRHMVHFSSSFYPSLSLSLSISFPWIMRQHNLSQWMHTLKRCSLFSRTEARQGKRKEGWQPWII